MEPKRISAAEVRRRLMAGEPLLLVSAYPSDDAFRQAALEGAISYRDFRSRLATLPKDQAVVFY